MESNYQIVQLANGAHSVRSLGHGETFHPVVGPVAEAEALYVKQLGLRETLAKEGELVVWDVGLGAAANPLAIIESLRSVPGKVRIVSFDHTLGPLRFALEHEKQLGYIAAYKEALADLSRDYRTRFSAGAIEVEWSFFLDDFPSFLKKPEALDLPKPHVILFDAFSPAKNPAMWTASVFSDIYRLLDPNRPCAMPTYSRSTLLRVTLLLAGFYVGAGHATGEKEETTIAANSPELIKEPLGERWLSRARKSKSAEPLWEPVYQQSPLSEGSWSRLIAHSQFSSLISLSNCRTA